MSPPQVRSASGSSPRTEVRARGSGRLGGALRTLRRWIDAGALGEEDAGASEPPRVDWLRVLPFAVLHLGCLGVLFVGVSPVAAGVALALYLVRMFAITAFYHRYFSHRAFKTSRPMQFLFAVIGNSAVQRGPLWWAAHHRHHHRHADEAPDVHSPVVHGFWWSHIGWITDRKNFATNASRIRDLSRYPELRFLDRFNVIVPILLATGLFAFGHWAETARPGWGTSGAQMLVWGFFISTTLLFHATALVNSLAHRQGSRRYETKDDSRNNLFVALVTLGEGWHNNHHRYPAAVRQGHRWYEIDPTWWGLALLSRLGLIWDLKPLPASLRARPEGD